MSTYIQKYTREISWEWVFSGFLLSENMILIINMNEFDQPNKCRNLGFDNSCFKNHKAYIGLTYLKIRS